MSTPILPAGTPPNHVGRVEQLDQATLSAVLLALADDRRHVLALRLQDRRARV